MAIAEKSILYSLKHESKQTIELKGQEFEEVPIDILLHEMSLRQKLIKKDPREVPAVPAYPDKSFENNTKKKS